MNKECSMCKEKKPLSEFYAQKRKSKEGNEWTYYNPECKECTKIRSMKWIKDNPDKFKIAYTKYDKRPEKKVKNRISGRKNRESGKYREWQNNNKDKLVGYRLNRANK
jgi:hypothetical protein